MPRRSQIAATILRARRAPIPADVEPPSSRDAGRGGGNDCRRCAGVPGVRAVSPPRIELSSTLAQRALRPPARPPPSVARRRRPRRAAVRAACALHAAWRRRGEPALPTFTPARARAAVSHARSCAWRPRVAAQVRLSGMGRSCVDGAILWAPREPIPASGARVAAAAAGPDGAGDDVAAREHMSQ
jgi:hypothetical protein